MDWLGEDAVNSELDEDTRRRLRRAIDDSRHVMFTPWEEIEVVHAVQRPLAPPDLQSEPEVARKPGDTDFQPNSTLVREPLSTGTIQLNASWTDVVDDQAVRFEAPADGAPMPWLRPVSTIVGSTALDEPELPGGVVPVMPRTDLYFPGSAMPRLQFSDTRRRTVTLTAVAMSRFADEFPELAGRAGAVHPHRHRRGLPSRRAPHGHPPLRSPTWCRWSARARSRCRSARSSVRAGGSGSGWNGRGSSPGRARCSAS